MVWNIPHHSVQGRADPLSATECSSWLATIGDDFKPNTQPQSQSMVTHGCFFPFLMKCQSGDINVIVVLQISKFIHMLDRKYYISTYCMSIILFSSTICRFHPKFLKVQSFFGKKLHYLSHFIAKLFFSTAILHHEAKKKPLVLDWSQPWNLETRLKIKNAWSQIWTEIVKPCNNLKL